MAHSVSAEYRTCCVDARINLFGCCLRLCLRLGYFSSSRSIRIRNFKSVHSAEYELVFTNRDISVISVELEVEDILLLVDLSYANSLCFACSNRYSICLIILENEFYRFVKVVGEVEIYFLVNYRRNVFPVCINLSVNRRTVFNG